MVNQKEGPVSAASDVVGRYLDAIERGDRPALEALLAPEMRFVERPNRLSPAGSDRDRDAILASFERGRGILRAQRYERVSVLVDGDQVAVELRWVGVLAVPVLGKAPGDELVAWVGAFFTVRGGQLVRQVNHDCFVA
jgi:ketosteroid isomerase-like protein